MSADPQTAAGEVGAQLAVADYRHLWDRIAPVIAKMLRRSVERFRLEDVYAALHAGRATLFACDRGFVILREYTNLDTGEKSVTVWIGASYGGRNAIEEYEPQLVALARQAGATRLVFNTPPSRRGYERKLPPEWAQEYVRWSREV
jgi:hypothetical protein